MSKILGKVGRNEIVLDKDDVRNALVLVDELPDPATTGWGCVQLSTTLSSDMMAGDIFKLKDGEWKKVEASSVIKGTVTHVICPAYNDDVQIRWTDIASQDTWKFTRVVRKFGSYPTDPFDGVIVTDSYDYNFYKDHILHDLVPMVPGEPVDKWFYRMFVFSSSGTYTTDAHCMFRPIAFTLENLPSIIRAGDGPKVFDIGDVICTETVNGVADEDKSFEVAGFDTVELEDANLSHCVVLVSTKCIYVNLPYDKKWDVYTLTSDTRYMSRDKVYYELDGSGNFVEATGLRLGALIPEGRYYEKNPEGSRTQIGGNRWSKSNLRKILNDTLISMIGGIQIIPPALMFPNLNSVVANAMVRTTMPMCDGTGAEYSVDRYFIPSLTEVFNRNPYHLWYSRTTDTNPKEVYSVTTDTVRDVLKTYFIFNNGVYRIATDSSFNPDGSFMDGITYYELLPKEYYVEDSEDGYRLAVDDQEDPDKSDYTPDHRFKNGVVYYEKNEININENGHLPSFDNELLDPKRKTPIGSGTHISWWLRSADIHTESEVLCVTDVGGQSSELCNVQLGVAVACVIA